jgi:hypothetical protein
MPDDFETGKYITIREHDDDVPYTFSFPICTSASANDGAVPYGLIISTAEVTAHEIDGTNASTLLIASHSLVGTIITVKLQYPGTAGMYHLVFTLTFSDGSDKDYTFDRVNVV